MRSLALRLGLIGALALSAPLLAGSDGAATTVLICRQPDRAASFTFAPDQLAAFRVAVATFGYRAGQTYETGGSSLNLMQVVRAKRWDWSFFAVSRAGESWAEAKFTGSGGCDQPLSEVEAEIWNAFLQAMAAKGFVADQTYRPRING